MAIDVAKMKERLAQLTKQLNTAFNAKKSGETYSDKQILAQETALHHAVKALNELDSDGAAKQTLDAERWKFVQLIEADKHLYYERAEKPYEYKEPVAAAPEKPAPPAAAPDRTKELAKRDKLETASNAMLVATAKRLDEVFAETDAPKQKMMLVAAISMLREIDAIVKKDPSLQPKLKTQYDGLSQKIEADKKAYNQAHGQDFDKDPNVQAWLKGDKKGQKDKAWAEALGTDVVNACRNFTTTVTHLGKKETTTDTAPADADKDDKEEELDENGKPKKWWQKLPLGKILSGLLGAGGGYFLGSMFGGGLVGKIAGILLAFGGFLVAQKSGLADKIDGIFSGKKKGDGKGADGHEHTKEPHKTNGKGNEQEATVGLTPEETARCIAHYNLDKSLIAAGRYGEVASIGNHEIGAPLPTGTNARSPMVTVSY